MDERNGREGVLTDHPKELPGLREHLKTGDMKPLKEWLNNKIHRQGSLLDNGDDLMKEVTHSQLDAKLFVDYLTVKYSDLYAL